MQSEGSSAAGPSSPRRPMSYEPAEGQETSSMITRWSSYFSGMLSSTPDNEKERLKMEKDWTKCEKWKTDLMKKSPIIVFMLKHLDMSGCPFTPDHVQCHPCDETKSGGFHPDYGIMLCQDRVYSKKHVEDTIAHEMIHAFDHCKFKVDWRNLRHQACSEIRASNLSGDCRFFRELHRAYFGFGKQHQACVKRRAILSVMGNPNCQSREMAEKAVNEVWESCWKDTRPFDEIY